MERVNNYSTKRDPVIAKGEWLGNGTSPDAGNLVITDYVFSRRPTTGWTVVGHGPVEGTIKGHLEYWSGAQNLT